MGLLDLQGWTERGEVCILRVCFVLRVLVGMGNYTADFAPENLIPPTSYENERTGGLCGKFDFWLGFCTSVR